MRCLWAAGPHAAADVVKRRIDSGERWIAVADDGTDG
jgi:hypothetical protein